MFSTVKNSQRKIGNLNLEMKNLLELKKNIELQINILKKNGSIHNESLLQLQIQLENELLIRKVS